MSERREYTYEPPAPPSVSTPPAPAPKESHRGIKIAAGATALVLAGGVAGAFVYGLHRTEAAQNQPAHEVQAAQSDQVQTLSNGFGSTSLTYPIAGSTATATAVPLMQKLDARRQTRREAA